VECEWTWTFGETGIATMGGYFTSVETFASTAFTTAVESIAPAEISTES
jgi:hypothetical protein